MDNQGSFADNQGSFAGTQGTCVVEHESVGDVLADAANYGVDAIVGLFVDETVPLCV